MLEEEIGDLERRLRGSTATSSRGFCAGARSSSLRTSARKRPQRLEGDGAEDQNGDAHRQQEDAPAAGIVDNRRCVTNTFLFHAQPAAGLHGASSAPSTTTNKEVSAIGGIFNYVTDVSRLTLELPEPVLLPLGEIPLLLRHYDSGRTHAGRPIGVIEGIAVRKAANAEFALALPQFVDRADPPDALVENIETFQPENRR